MALAMYLPLPTPWRLGSGYCMCRCEGLLQSWPAARFSVWLNNQHLRSSAAPPNGHDSNDSKSTVESISALVPISSSAVTKAGH